MRIGLIGTGKHGSRYGNHIVNDLPGVQLAAISRRSEKGKEQAGQWGTAYYPDWQDLVADTGVDAVVAVTPPGINLEIARFCALHAKPLLMEKPLARNSDEAAEIVRLMTSADCPLTVGQTLRYNPVIRSLKDQLPGMGKLHSFSVNQRIEPSVLAWHDDPDTAGAGVVMHTAVHVFDALKQITGTSVKRVMAKSHCVHSRTLEDLVVLLAEFENGICGTVDVSKVGHARSGRFEFICNEGQLVGEQIHGFTEQVRNSSIQSRKRFEPFPAIMPLLTDWLSFLNGECENPVPGEDGRYVVQVCSAVLESAKKKRWVELEC